MSFLMVTRLRFPCEDRKYDLLLLDFLSLNILMNIQIWSFPSSHALLIVCLTRCKYLSDKSSSPMIARETRKRRETQKYWMNSREQKDLIENWQ